MAMETDRDNLFGDHQDIPYLDSKTGEILWIFEDDEDAESIANISAEENREMREAIEAAPDRYLEVPGVDHGELYGRLYTEFHIAGARRATGVRLCPHLYNTMEEIDRAVAGAAAIGGV